MNVVCPLQQMIPNPIVGCEGHEILHVQPTYHTLNWSYLPIQEGKVLDSLYRNMQYLLFCHGLL